MDLDELLRVESHAPDLQPAARQGIRDAVMSAARQDVCRRARLARVRRVRPVLLGAAAAAVAGVTAVAVIPHDGPSRDQQRSVGGPPQPRFATVAEVIDAASVATNGVDPTGAPYWKVTVSNCTGATLQPACTFTWWKGIDRPGVHSAGDPAAGTWYDPECAATISVNGSAMSWSTVNRRSWSTSELMKAIAGPATITTIRRSGRTLTATTVPAPASARTETLFWNALDVLAYEPASSSIKRQVWEGLRSMTSLRLDGEHADLLGRAGWRITLPAAGADRGEESMLVDPSTGAVLEVRTSTATGPVQVSTVISAEPAKAAPAPSSQLAPSACDGSQGSIAAGVSTAP